MGKTPAKWLKTLILGKKSPKPKLSKDKDILNPAYVGERETLVSLNAPPTGFTENPPRKLLPITKANGSYEVDQDEVAADRVPNVETPSPIQNADEVLLLQAHSLEDHEKVRLHEAATKAQAAYRGYLARRAFRTLKGIVRLQALIRGHLVRRQAIATLCCLRSIVKFQTIIRSRKDPQCATPLMKFEVKLLKDVYIQKLLSLTLSARPLHLQYAPGDPNSVLEWLERWTKSRFWDPPPVQQLKKKSKSQPKPKPKQLAAAEVDQTRPKRSARKLPSSNVETGPIRSSSQTEKVKRHVGKASGDPASQNGNEKSKVSLRRTRDPVKVVESDKKKSDHNVEKAPDTPVCDEVVDPITTIDHNTGKEDSVETISRNKSVEPAGEELLHDLADELSLTELNKEESNTAIATEKEQNSEDVNGNQQISNRRVSLPAKMENGSNGSIPKRPSYMAPTKSAKAKLRAQGSSSPPTDDAEKSAEKNGYTRRLSLPNGKVTSFSPRAHKPVEASTAKGAIKIEKSLSSSRDGSDKANKAEWKR